MVCTPPVPIEKLMRSGPPAVLVVLFVAMMASRSDIFPSEPLLANKAVMDDVSLPSTVSATVSTISVFSRVNDTANPSPDPPYTVSAPPGCATPLIEVDVPPSTTLFEPRASA